MRNNRQLQMQNDKRKRTWEKQSFEKDCFKNEEKSWCQKYSQISQTLIIACSSTQAGYHYYLSVLLRLDLEQQQKQQLAFHIKPNFSREQNSSSFGVNPIPRHFVLKRQNVSSFLRRCITLIEALILS